MHESINFLYVKRGAGESLEDFDHVLDVVGRGYQLAVNFAHTVTTRGRQRLN